MGNDGKDTLAYRLAWILPIAAGVGWGIVGVFIRILTDEGLDNVTIVAVRSVTGLILVMLYLALFGRDQLRISLRDVPLLFVMTLAGAVILMLTYNIAVVELSLSLAAVLMSTAPAFVLLVSAVLFREKITLRKVMCMLGALAGCILLSEVLEPGGMRWSRIGILMGILSMVMNGVWILLSKVIADKGYGSFTVCLYTFLFTAVMLAPFADWGAVAGYIAAKPAQSMAVLIGQSLCTSILPTAGYIIALRYLDAGKTAILEGGAEPAGALLMGIALYGEIPSMAGMAGFLLVVIALGFLSADKQ